VGEEFRKMPAGEREKLGKERRQAGMKMMKERMNKYFSLSDEEKKAWLDEEIDRGEAMRKEWEKRRAERQANGQGGGQGGGRGGFGQGQNGGNGGGPNGLGDRSRFRKDALNWSSPEERNQFSQYMQQLQQRRQQRGIKGGGRGFF
jgi:hypothetical protein